MKEIINYIICASLLNLWIIRRNAAMNNGDDFSFGKADTQSNEGGLRPAVWVKR